MYRDIKSGRRQRHIQTSQQKNGEIYSSERGKQGREHPERIYFYLRNLYQPSDTEREIKYFGKADYKNVTVNIPFWQQYINQYEADNRICDVIPHGVHMLS